MEVTGRHLVKPLTETLLQPLQISLSDGLAGSSAGHRIDKCRARCALSRRDLKVAQCLSFAHRMLQHGDKVRMGVLGCPLCGHT